MSDAILMYLILALLVGTTGWELYTGRTRRRNWSVATRQSNPLYYWYSVVIKIVVFFLVLFFWQPGGDG